MFFRQKKSPSGQCLQLLESYRNGQGQPRQHVVVSLGGLTIAQADRALIARLVEQRLHGQTQLQCLSDNAGALSLADSISKRVEREGRWRPVPVAACPGPSEGASATIDGVMLDLITHTHTTPVGPTLVGWQAWKRLGMPELLGKLGFNPAQEQAAATSVINRLIDPGSELALVDWLPNSSLPELMEMEIGPAAKDRFYRVSDRLFEHRHRVFNGNQSDSKSLIHMIEEMDKLVPLKDKQSTVLLDGGIATKANLALLRKKHYHYLVNDSRRGRANYRAELLKEDEFTVVGKREDKSEVRVRKMADPLWVAPAAQAAAKEDKAASAAADSPPDKGKPPQEGPEVADTLVLCWSEGREQKETAICSQAEEKYLKALEQLSKRMAEGKLKDGKKIERTIGRLQQKHPRVQRFYQVEWVAGPRGKELKWPRQDEKKQANEELLGCYVLRTDQGKGTAEEIWNLYMTLSKAEDGFRSLKGDLGLRPNYHQIGQRVEGHIWIAILAYHLLCWIQETLRESGDNRRWKTIRRVLQTHCYTTIVVPTKGGKTYRIRKAGEPEELQKSIYEKLDVKWDRLPETKLEVETEAIL